MLPISPLVQSVRQNVAQNDDGIFTQIPALEKQLTVARKDLNSAQKDQSESGRKEYQQASQRIQNLETQIAQIKSKASSTDAQENNRQRPQSALDGMGTIIDTFA